MRISVGMITLLILAFGIVPPPEALAQEAPDERGEEDALGERGAPRELRIGDFIYRLGDGVPWGPLQLHPYGAQYFVYDDNVFLTDPDDPVRDETAEFSSETVLGLRADLPFSDHYLSAEYQAQFVAYLVEDTPNLVRHLAQAQLRLNFAKAYAEVTNTFRNTDDPVDLPDLGRFRRASDHFDALAGVRFDKLGIEAGVHDRYYDFLNSETNYLDHNEIFIHGRVFYDFSPKFSAYGQYDYGFSAYGDDESRASSPPGSGLTLNDYTYSRIWAGALYRPGQKLSLHGRLGVMMQTVDEDSGTLPDDEEYQGAVAGASIGYAPTAKVKVSAGYLRDLQFSGTSNYQIIDRLDGRLDYRFTQKFLTALLVFLENSDPSLTDTFQRHGFGVILDYRMRDWLHLGAQYQYRQRVGTDTGDYTNNRILGNVTIYF